MSSLFEALVGPCCGLPLAVLIAGVVCWMVECRTQMNEMLRGDRRLSDWDTMDAVKEWWEERKDDE